ncbi:MAG: cytochrome c oxidase accessory protein CcoG [Chitinophagia bacterium]|jgi:cytochrome c oxidase accessory protein FixG|nr:cytochrome c oxidase accessory protein CcoG [Chitinophagia bacterium]
MAGLLDPSGDFRDTLYNVDTEGNRKWIYPKKPSGKLYDARTWVSYFLLLFLFGAPYLRYNNKPLFLIDVLHRNIIISGIHFGPQDIHLLLLSLLSLILFVILFTVIFGRIWCGWACPQTIFLEMLFRKIEYWIDGDRNKKLADDKKPQSFQKVFKLISKHLIFWILSFIIANTFLSYIIGTDALWKIILGPFEEHYMGFISMAIFTTVFYFVFSRLRELVCIVVCPYGRLQGVLLDKESIVVAYDFLRGEPRGKLHKEIKNTDIKTGDCIDCKQCVVVCPTGIDIRNGTQLECVNCTACIDACDDIMDKIEKPRGLIRYASYQQIANGIPFRLSPRVLAYSLVLIGLLSLTGFLFINRNPIETSILRVSGTMYQQDGKGNISNIYTLDVVNKTEDTLHLVLSSPQGEIVLTGKDAIAPPAGQFKGSFLLLIPERTLQKMSTPIEINIASKGIVLEQVKTKFLGPSK